MRQPKLEICDDYGGQRQVGYGRIDIPALFHTIARAPGGTFFTIGNHFDNCLTCRHHGVTQSDFDAFMRSQ